MPCGYPVLNDWGTPCGVIVILINLKQFASIIKEVKLPEGSDNLCVR